MKASILVHPTLIQGPDGIGAVQALAARTGKLVMIAMRGQSVRYMELVDSRPMPARLAIGPELGGAA